MAKDLMYQDEIQCAVRDVRLDRERCRRGRRVDALQRGRARGAARGRARLGPRGRQPRRYAFLQPGEVVLDVGPAAGSTRSSPRVVGPTGRAIGLDIVEAMIDRARATPRTPESRVDRVPAGGDELVPLPDASADVVISNGVLNLSARKSRALAEIFRVLKPAAGSRSPT